MHSAQQSVLKIRECVWPHPQLVLWGRGSGEQEYLCGRGTLALDSSGLSQRRGKPGITAPARQRVREAPYLQRWGPRVFCFLSFQCQTPRPSIINEKKVDSMEHGASKAKSDISIYKHFN